jgi:hypothetical protein
MPVPRVCVRVKGPVGDFGWRTINCVDPILGWDLLPPLRVNFDFWSVSRVVHRLLYIYICLWFLLSSCVDSVFLLSAFSLSSYP